MLLNYLFLSPKYLVVTIKSRVYFHLKSSVPGIGSRFNHHSDLDEVLMMNECMNE